MSQAPNVRLAVVMERRTLDNRWESEVWQPVEVRADATAQAEAAPQLLEDAGGRARWLHTGLTLTLHLDECEGYWQNLVSPGPRIFVMWREEEALAVPQRVTASYDEASAWMDASESVEGVQMPEALVPWVGDFLKANFKPAAKPRIRPESFKRPKDRAQS